MEIPELEILVVGNFAGFGGISLVVDYFSYFPIFVIGNYLVGFLSARHLVGIPEFENLNFNILVVGNFGGWKFWWLEII